MEPTYRALYRRRADFRFGIKADICIAKRDVRFNTNSGHVRCN